MPVQHIEIDLDEVFHCLYCGTLVVDLRDGSVERCPHLLFAYIWGEEDVFLAVRPDVAADYIEEVLKSKEYQQHLEEGGDPLSEQMKEAFMRGVFQPDDPIATDIASFGQGSPDQLMPDALPENTLVFINDGYHSGIKLAFADSIKMEDKQDDQSG